LNATGQKFAAVTSIMALQFDKDIAQTAENIQAALIPGGVAAFAVFNPDHVTSCLKAGSIFENFDSVESPKTGFINLDGQMRTCLYSNC